MLQSNGCTSVVLRNCRALLRGMTREMCRGGSEEWAGQAGWSCLFSTDTNYASKCPPVCAQTGLNGGWIGR